MPELGVRTVVGVDLDADAGRSNDGLDDFIVADLCGSLPFPARTFDLVYASFVVEHLEKPEHALREWRGIVRDAGERRPLRALLLRAEAVLPPERRSTLVVSLRPRSSEVS
jgi:ubiquinone/menaquinone biosynthesis C-methylase UbiE